MPKTTTGGKRNQSKPLTDSEAEALEWYISGEGMWINQYFRGNLENGFINELTYRESDLYNLSENEKSLIKDIENATNKSLAPQILYRAVDAQTIFGKMTNSEFEDLVNKIVYKSNDRFSNQTYSKLMKNVKKNYTEKGFMSTTKSYSVAKDWNGFTGSDKDIVLRIKTTKKTKGLDLTKQKKGDVGLMSRGQQEVLLRRNQNYKVNKISSKDGKIMVDVEI